MNDAEIKKRWDEADGVEVLEAQRVGKSAGKRWVEMMANPSTLRRLSRNNARRNTHYESWEELQHENPDLTPEIMHEIDTALSQWGGDEYLESAFVQGFVEAAIDRYEQINREAA